MNNRALQAAQPPASKTGLKILRPLVDRLTETADDDSAFPQRQEEALAAARNLTTPLTQEERSLLERLGAWARQAQDRPDPKFDAFRRWLDAYVPQERVIVFTEYRDTQRWLHERLIGAGYAPDSIAQLYGGQDEAEREHVKAVFQDDLDLDPLRILLATDAASEGINLQNHCHRLLHWEIPWNPNRLEQRNGRIDRHGQPTGDRASAEDIVQETLIRGHRHWEKISGLERPESYVRKMITNEFLSSRRRMRRLVPLGHGSDVDNRVTPDHAIRGDHVRV